MFAYCLNNPVNCYDPSGNAAFWTSTGDWNPLHSGYYGIGGAGGGGSGKSGYKDIIDELSDKTNKTLDTIGSVADDCWDAYVQGHYWQQEVQMQEARAKNELIQKMANGVYDYVTDSEFWSTDVGIVTQSTLVGMGIGAVTGFAKGIEGGVIVTLCTGNPAAAVPIIVSETLFGIGNGAVQGFISGIVTIAIW